MGLLLATKKPIQTFSSSKSTPPKLHEEQDGRVKDQAELPRGLRGVDQQADQHGILCLVCLSSMSSWFNRDDQALHGFAAHFKNESGEERAHGMKLMESQTKRGGRVVFQDIAKPTTMEWGTPLEAMEAALKLEKTVNQSLIDIHKAAQVKGIKSIGVWITKIKRAGDGLGLHIIDKEIGS